MARQVGRSRSVVQAARVRRLSWRPRRKTAAMGGDRSAHDELRVVLREPNELFDYGPPNVLEGNPGSYPGIDRIRNELSSGSPQRPRRLAVLLPPEHITSQTQRGIRDAIASYCDGEIRRAEHDLGAAQRDGWQTLLLGLVVLAAGLALSTIFTENRWPQTIRVFFGDGVFLVIAWVGVWYPLDTLFYAGRPYRIERKLLQAIRELEIVVRPLDAEGLEREAARPYVASSGDQSLHEQR
jgi:hypothetical protein